MTKIEEFLTHFDDQHLANLQCAAEDGRLVYQDACNCLLHHFNGEYSITKWEGETAKLARGAEDEFLDLGNHKTRIVTLEAGDPDRRKAILPLIHAEWIRRSRIPHNDWRKIGQEFNEIEELPPVSLSIR